MDYSIRRYVDTQQLSGQDIGITIGQNDLNMCDQYSSELRSRFLLRLLQGEIKDTDTLSEQIQQLNLPQTGYRHVVCLIAANDEIATVASDTALCYLRTRLTDFLNDNGVLTTCCMDQKNRLVVVASSNAVDNMLAKVDVVLPNISGEVSKTTGIGLSFSIGPEIDQFVQVPESYSYAEAILQHSVISQNDLELDTGKLKYSLSDDIHQQLVQMFREGDIRGITDAVQKHVETIKLNHTGRQVLIERFAVSRSSRRPPLEQLSINRFGNCASKASHRWYKPITYLISVMPLRPGSSFLCQ